MSNKIAAQTISTIAGNGTPGYSGDGGTATTAKLNLPWGVAVDACGNVYIGDGSNNRVRMVNTSGVISTIAGTGTLGYSGDGGAATAAKITRPAGLAVDNSGNIYIADEFNNRIRKINASGIISTIAGNGTPGYSGDGGAATLAELYAPEGVAIDNAGNVFISDDGNNRVRKINTSGIITTIAGTGTLGYGGDGGPATAALFEYPNTIALDNSGNIYVSDGGNERIRKINTSGIITTVAGNGTGVYSGDGGPATAAQIGEPWGIAIDNSGNLFFSDGNSRIRKVNTSGIINTVAGNGSAFYGGDGGPATSASINTPLSIALDIAGNIYIAEKGSNRVRKVSYPSPTISGSTTVCAGATITLSIILSGGSWSSSNTTIASVGSGTGIVTGVSAGIATISYSIVNWCGTTVATKTVTVNPLPNTGTITGALTACVGSTVTLSETVSGGIWSSSNTAIASIGSSTGIVSGVSSGTAAISYSVTNSCGTASATQIVTINPLPNAGVISGVTSVTAGSTILMTDTAPGGIWSVSNGNASVSGGTVTGLFPGLDTVSYTVTNSCGSDVATTVITVVDTVDTTSSVAIVQQANEFTLYPNPATTMLTVSAPTKINQITISNLLSQQIYSEVYHSEIVVVNIADFATGFYIVKINGSEVRKFVKK